MPTAAKLIIVLLLCTSVRLRAAELLSPSTRPTSRPANVTLSNISVATAKRQFDAWKPPIAPRKLIGNISYVGASGVSSFLITTPEGHILIDTTFEDTLPQIQTGIAKLGFKIEDIKYILSSHTHADHTAGHALMKKLTGAKIVASEADGHLLELGGDDDYSPYPRELMLYTPVKPDIIIKDGDTIKLGDVTLTALLTPGHTRGATTWLMDVADDAGGGKIHHVAFASSYGVAGGTRLIGNPIFPDIVPAYRETFVKLKKLDIDVYFGPHGDQFNMVAKFQRQDRGGAADANPFIDPAGWKSMISSAERGFESALTTQTAGGR